MREARTPTVAALPRHLLAAPRECAACGTPRGALVRHFVEILLQARLSPRVGHKLPLIKAIPQFAMRAQRTALVRITHGSPSQREASCNHSRKGAAPSPAPCICAYLRFCRKVRSRALYCCYPRAIEGNRAQSVCGCGVFLNLTELSYRSTRKKDFAERFFAKRSGKRCKRGVRLRRTTRRVRFAATMSVQKEIRELFTGRTRRR